MSGAHRVTCVDVIGITDEKDPLRGLSQQERFACLVTQHVLGGSGQGWAVRYALTAGPAGDLAAVQVAAGLADPDVLTLDVREPAPGSSGRCGRGSAGGEGSPGVRTKSGAEGPLVAGAGRGEQPVIALDGGSC